MISALLRLFWIGVASLAVLGGALFFIRWLGLSQEFAPLSHPLLESPYVIFADGGDLQAGPPQSEKALRALKNSCPSCIAKVDLRRSLDGKWFLYETEALEKYTGGQGYFSLQPAAVLEQTFYKAADGSASDQRILSLADLDRLFPQEPFLLVIHSRDASHLREILPILEARKAAANLVIQSPFRQILTDARKERPLWLFGMSPSSFVRVLMMEALYIETMADIWSDLVISPSQLHGTAIFTDRLLKELKRRHKKIVLVEEEPLDQLPENLKSSLYGVVTKNPQQARQFFDQLTR